MKSIKLFSVFLLLSILLIKLLFPFYFEHFFNAIPAWKGSPGLSQMHYGDQLQQYYLSWVQHQNIKNGWSIFKDPYLFATKDHSFLDMEITPLYFTAALLGFLMPFHVAFNLAYTVLPLMLIGVFTYLFLSLFTTYRLLAFGGALLTMLYPYRLEYQLLGHHAGAYAFFIPLLLWLLERQMKLGLSWTRAVCLVFVFPVAAIAELHIGYYCVLMTVLWAGLRGTLILARDGLTEVKRFAVRLFPVAVGIGMSGLFGWTVKHYVLQNTGVLPVRGVSEISFYSLPVFDVFMNPHQIYGYPVFLLLGVIPILFLFLFQILKKQRNPHFELGVMTENFLVYFLLLVFFVITTAGTKGIGAFYMLLYKVLPGFSMQRVPHKMAYVAQPLFCLMGIFIYDYTIRIFTNLKGKRNVLKASVILFLAFVFGFQVYKMQRMIPKFPLHDPSLDDFSELHRLIKEKVPEEGIIVRLPLENGQYPDDGHAFFHILKTKRRFFNGYHGAPPRYYLDLQDDFSRVYDGSASPLIFQTALNHGIRWLLFDLSINPTLALQSIAVYKEMPFLTVVFHNDRHVLFYINREPTGSDRDVFNQRNPSPYLMGWSALSSLAEHQGRWMKQEPRDESKGILSTYAHRLQTPLPQDYQATVHYRVAEPLSVTMGVEENKMSLERNPNQNFTAQIILPKGTRSSVITFISEDLFIPSKSGHSDPNHYGYFIQSIQIKPAQNLALLGKIDKTK